MDVSILHLHTLQLILLAFFTVATTLLAMVTLTNMIRLRSVRQVWRYGKLFGYPLFATIFLGFSLVITSVVWYNGLDQHIASMLCYIWIGVNWFVASHLMNKRYITDNGIVKNINDPSQTVAWHQVRDYVEYQQEKGSQFAFFYTPSHSIQDSGSSIHNMRLELTVPEKEVEEFKRILSRKLGRRFSPAVVYTDTFEQVKKK